MVEEVDVADADDVAEDEAEDDDNGLGVVVGDVGLLGETEADGERLLELD